MKKKILSILLAVCLLAGCLPLGAGAEEADLLPLEEIIEQRKTGFMEQSSLQQSVAPVFRSTKTSSAASVLISYIEKYGEVDPDGDRYIEYSFSEEDWSSVTRIFYIPLYDEILFLTGHFFPGYTLTTMMGYDLQTESASDGITTTVLIEGTDTEIEGECANFNIRSYEKGTTLHFVSDEIWTGAEDYQKLCNANVELSLVMWEGALEETGLGISMYDFGFVRYFTAPDTSGFVDVKSSDYFYDAVNWAVEKNVTAGTDASHFSPDRSCTRAQAVAFLWRAAGEPEPQNTAASFTDVASGAYYEKAVSWAVEQGITSGTGAGKFSPEDTCTRAQIVSFLYRAAGSPAVSAGSSFSDVEPGAYYENAVRWAVANGITAGTGGGKFSPNARCVRGQVVSFLYRYYK